MGALLEMGEEQQLVRIVPFADGLEPDDDRRDEAKLNQSIYKVMPGYLEDLIKKVNQQEGNEKVACVVADVTCGWALEIAAKLGLKGAVFFTASPGILPMTLQLPKLLESGIINTDGTPRRDEKVELSPNLPPLSPAELFWLCPGNPSLQKGIFAFVPAIYQILTSCNFLLCNWFHELEPSVTDLLPNISTVGPILANGRPSGNFWSEDLTCLSWLDRQPPKSVIYAAFGSSSMFSQQQLSELALSLELIGRPFLWVARQDLTNGNSAEYPEGFPERVANLGKIVEWAPQEKVLAHPAVACYLTHCGWNSTMEGLSMGVPLLCWPYFGDQFYNKTCICEGWKIGLWLKGDENGIVNRHEMKRKVDELLSSVVIRENVLKMKELAEKSGKPGGSSSKSLEEFIKQIV
ncbi:hypothetical protein Patl1_18866 [Pistacia atlantica]|uniref:Uncharacterized protein n=1 Tax=Pistacia atlantica TaxID=434234 RepID=A0ACC1C043_9ROSI|nr:hypothetical protein Patl1_18866 [Pistacia atlantica]